MSDRDTLITAIADEIQRVHGTPHRVMPDASASNVLAALDRLGYRVVGPAEQAVLDAVAAWGDAIDSRNQGAIDDALVHLARTAVRAALRGGV